MPRKKAEKTQKPIEQYEHKDKERVNNPPVGLVTPETDPDKGQRMKKLDDITRVHHISSTNWEKNRK